jgi:16S rRNA processing protein RimM
VHVPDGVTGWDRMARIGQIVRPQGRRGEVVVAPDTDYAEARFAVGAVVYLPGADVREPRRVEVRSSREWRGRWVVGLEGIESIDAAEALRDAELRIPAESLRPLADGQYYVHDLAGCAVVTAGGREVGVVERVDLRSGTPLLVVQGPVGEVLVPLAEPICRVVDVVGRRIVIDPPEGLVDLNAR